jgi:hypothetical protein
LNLLKDHKLLKLLILMYWYDRCVDDSCMWSPTVRSRTSDIRRAVLAVGLPTVAALAGMHLGCTKPQTMVSTEGVPAIQGTVKAAKDENGNTKVSIRVDHLDSPSKVASDSAVYVVWIQPRGASKQNLGALAWNDTLVGSLDTVTPHRRFLILVTPEPGARGEQPTHDPVFTSEVERPE